MTRVLLDARKARDFGIGRYIVGLIGALARRGDFELQAVVHPRDRDLLPPGVAPILSEAAHYSVGELVAVRKAIRSARPDLFHAPHYVVPLAPPRRTVVTIHDLMHLSRAEHASPLKRIYARAMIGRAVRSAARIVTVSETARGELVGAFPSAAEKTVVIPNGVGGEFFEAVPDAGGAPYLLFLGNDKPHKNLDGLLAAFALLRAAHPRLRLLLAGVPPGKRSASGVEPLGYVADAELPPLVAGARALVLPSFAEGFGLPVLEAQAAGTPVACSDIPVLRETSGDAAVFFDPHAPESIARTVAALLRDEAERSRVRNLGRERAAAMTWDRAAARTASVYREVLAG